MSGRPWLESLKATLKECGADTNEPTEKISEALAEDGCERCESPADAPTPVVDVQTACLLGGLWGEEERRLIAAGWKPKERCGKIIWQRPDNGFYVSQEAALHFLNTGKVNVRHKSGANGKG